MTRLDVSQSLSAAWIALAIAVFALLKVWTSQNFALFALVGAVAPLIVLRFLHLESPPTIAEVLHATERER